MNNKRIFSRGLCLSLLTWFTLTALAQDTNGESIYSFSTDGAFVSKYIWRGQRLTNDGSFQPSGTFGVGKFSFNVWGNMDLTAVNPGDSLFIKEDPNAPAGMDHNGLKGKFSEIDYTFSFAHSFKDVTIDAGTIFYTFPERSASLPSTTEFYGGVTLDSAPLSPSATLYIDVDETRAGGGTSGLYFLLGAGHSFSLPNKVFQSLDLSGTLAFVNSGFSEFYYGASDSGVHDFNFGISLPLTISENVSANAFVNYTALISDFRDYQFLDPRRVFLGTAGTPRGAADTIWGGLSISLGF